MSSPTDDRLHEAAAAYDRATFAGEFDQLEPVERFLDELDAEVALGRGRVRHARYQQSGVEDPLELADFERAHSAYVALGDVRGEAEALFWLGCLHQVIRSDDTRAVPLLQRSAELAQRCGDHLTRSYALRHLGIAAHVDGDLASARGHLAESTRLRRELGFLSGAAANLVGLAYVAVADGRGSEAPGLLDDAAELAALNGATVILAQVDQARAALG